jgi:hypothetical protein
MFIGDPVTKCLEIKKYSDTSQKQAAFFRNPYESIPSAVVKARIDWETGFDDLNDLKYNIEKSGEEYLTSIKEAKVNQSNLYLGKSEDMMADPIGTIEDIALFFDLPIVNNILTTNDEVNKKIKSRMEQDKKTRVNKHGKTVVETLMSDHDGHMPRQKIEQRVFIDKLVQELDLEIIRQCYNEYMSINSTNAKEGQRWGS